MEQIQLCKSGQCKRSTGQRDGYGVCYWHGTSWLIADVSEDDISIGDLIEGFDLTMNGTRTGRVVEISSYFPSLFTSERKPSYYVDCGTTYGDGRPVIALLAEGRRIELAEPDDDAAIRIAGYRVLA